MGSLYHWYQSSSGSSMASSVTMEEMREELLKEMIDLMIKMREVILTSGLARSEKDIGFDPGGKNSVQSLSVSSLCRVEAVRARDRDFCSLSGDNDANGDEEEDVDEDADYSSDEEDEDDASCEEEDEDDVADGDVDSVGNDDEILNSIGSLGDDSGKVADFFSLGTMVMTDLHQLSQSVAEQFRDTKPQHPWPDEISVSGNESKLHHYDGRRNSQQYCNLEQVYRSRRSIAHLRYRVSVHGRDLEGESQPDYERYRCGDDESYWKKEPEVDKPVMVDKGANLGSLSGGNDAGGGGDDKADIGAVDSAGNNVIFDLNCSFGDAYGEMLCGGMCLRSTVKSGKDAGCFSLGVYCDEVAVNFPHQKISARKPPKDYTLAINNICLSTMATCDPRHGKSMDMLLVYLHDHEQKKNSDLWQYVCELVSAGKLIEIVVLDMKFITMCSLWDCLLVAQEVFDGLLERSLYQSSSFEFVLMLSLENASLLGGWLAFPCNAPVSDRRASISEADVSAIHFGGVLFDDIVNQGRVREEAARSCQVLGGAKVLGSCDHVAQPREKPFSIDPGIVVLDKSKYVFQQTLKLQENLEDVPIGELPCNMLLSVDRHLVQTVPPGTRLTVIGINSIYQAANSSSTQKGAVAVRQPDIRVIGIERTHDDFAGLTASIIRDGSFRNFYFEGSAMVLADGGVVYIVEFDTFLENMDQSNAFGWLNFKFKISNKFLFGPIPAEFGNLRSLKKRDLSSNNLFGDSFVTSESMTEKENVSDSFAGVLFHTTADNDSNVDHLFIGLNANGAQDVVVEMLCSLLEHVDVFVTLMNVCGQSMLVAIGQYVHVFLFAVEFSGKVLNKKFINMCVYRVCPCWEEHALKAKFKMLVVAVEVLIIIKTTLLCLIYICSGGLVILMIMCWGLSNHHFILRLPFGICFGDVPVLFFIMLADHIKKNGQNLMVKKGL